MMAIPNTVIPSKQKVIRSKEKQILSSDRIAQELIIDSNKSATSSDKTSLSGKGGICNETLSEEIGII